MVVDGVGTVSVRRRRRKHETITAMTPTVPTITVKRRALRIPCLKQMSIPSYSSFGSSMVSAVVLCCCLHIQLWFVRNCWRCLFYVVQGKIPVAEDTLWGSYEALRVLQKLQDCYPRIVLYFSITKIRILAPFHNSFFQA